MEFKFKDQETSETDMIHLQGALGCSLASYDSGLYNTDITLIGLPKTTLKLSTSFNIDTTRGSPCCIVSDGIDLLLATYDGRLLIFQWKSTSFSEAREYCLYNLIQNITAGEDYSNKQITSKDLHISEMICDNSAGIMAWILSNGYVYVVERELESWIMLEEMPFTHIDTHIQSGSQDNGKIQWKVHFLMSYNQKPKNEYHATCLAMNYEHRILAFGDQLGDIYIYKIDDISRINFRCYNLLSHIRSSDIISQGYSFFGKVTSLLWIANNAILVASYEHGLALWTKFGYLIAAYPEPFPEPE
jgi:hypothetical protein